MGRDVTGLRVDMKPSTVEVKSNGTSHDAAHGRPEEDETKESEPYDHNQDASDEEITDKSQHFHIKEADDDEDNRSLASFTSTSAQASKFRVTVPVAPRFTCGERLERRKEYYAQLEEKHKVLEKEKQEREDRIQEEEAKAIKQLRKSMAYKANPIPSFYREGPPTKVELKKPPVTRPKSPKLIRRRSCGDAGKTSDDDTGVSERASRHITGIFRDGKKPLVIPNSKNRIRGQKSNENAQVKDHPEEQDDAVADNGVES